MSKNISEIYHYIKQKKIPYSYIKEETGFTTVYISLVLTGKNEPSERFMRLILHALHKRAHKQIEDFNALIGDSPWQKYL